MLYIIQSDYFLSRFLLDGLLHTTQRRVIVHRRKKLARGIRGSLRKIWAMLWPGRRSAEGLFEADYVEQLRGITASDRVLLFDLQNLKELLLLRRLIAARHVTVYLWNPVRSFNRNVWSRWSYPRQLRAAGFAVYTFDREDAHRYGFIHTNQLYRSVDAALRQDKGPFDADLFFIGQDKGRAGKLLQMKSMAESEGLRCCFFVLPDKHSLEPLVCGMRSGGAMPYDQTLRWISRSRCLVEVLQQGQSGETLRALEALFYGRKLLTNNPEADRNPFYSPDRVFIFGKDHPDRLRAFIEQPMADDYMEALLGSSYNIEVWLRQF